MEAMEGIPATEIQEVPWQVETQFTVSYLLAKIVAECQECIQKSRIIDVGLNRLQTYK